MCVVAQALHKHHDGAIFPEQGEEEEKEANGNTQDLRRHSNLALAIGYFDSICVACVCPQWPLPYSHTPTPHTHTNHTCTHTRTHMKRHTHTLARTSR